MTCTAAKTQKLTTSDGLQLHVHRWEVAKPRGSVLVIPGKGDHGGRYEELALALGKSGWRTWALDPRGQGQSEGPRSQIDRFDEFQIDLTAAIEAIQLPEAPLVVIGYSMGAVTAVLKALAEPDSIQGLILMSPALSIANRFKGMTKALAYLANWVCPHRIVARGYNPAAVTGDLEEQRRITADPFIDGITRPRLIIELYKAARECMDRVHELTQPVLILASREDRIVDSEGAERFYSCLKGDSSICWYLDQRHDLLHEREREQVIADIAHWLEKHGTFA